MTNKFAHYAAHIAHRTSPANPKPFSCFLSGIDRKYCRRIDLQLTVFTATCVAIAAGITILILRALLVQCEAQARKYCQGTALPLILANPTAIVHLGGRLAQYRLPNKSRKSAVFSQ